MEQASEEQAGVPPSYLAPVDRVYPDKLCKDECMAIAQRRKVAWAGNSGECASGVMGVALSGGGIRSATISLGLFQAFARHRIIGYIDYLSTVSGGGYFGAFLGRLFTRPWVHKPLSDSERKSGKCRCPWLNKDLQVDEYPGANVPRVESVLKDLFSNPVRWLRDHGRYLAPNGAGDVWRMAIVILRNWAALTMVWAMSVLAVFLFMNMLRALLWRYAHGASLWWESPFLAATKSSIWWSPWCWLALAVFLLFAVPPGLAYWLVRDRASKLSPPGRWPVILIALFAAAIVISAIYLYGEPVFKTACCLVLLSTIIFACRAMCVTRRKKVAKTFGTPPGKLLTGWLVHAVAITLVLYGFALVDTLGQTLYVIICFEGWQGNVFRTLASLIGLIGFMGLVRKLYSILDFKPGRSLLRQIPLNILAAAAAISLLTAMLVGLSAVSHGFLWAWRAPAPVVLDNNEHKPIDPGGNIMAWHKNHSAVSLDGERRIRVDDAPAGEPDRKTTANMDHVFAALAAAAALLISFLLGRATVFLNRCSNHALYGRRLEQAYLYASNQKKWSGSAGREFEDPRGLKFKKYCPHKFGGPIHLINLTLNETVIGKTLQEYRDRKGIGMTVGPCGVSAGINHHARWVENREHLEPIVQPGLENNFHVFLADLDKDARGMVKPVAIEQLPLHLWVAASGAAVTTGLGTETRLGYSLLLGLMNIRLGYWLDSGIDPEKRSRRLMPGWFGRRGYALSKIIPVQGYLLDEFLARFHGPGRRYWYLSDGAHFENTGCYELIRRRVPFIVVCDNGGDPSGKFRDIANLVRKARIDFKAEIRFFDDIELEEVFRRRSALRASVGTLEDLRGMPQQDAKSAEDEETPCAGRSRKHAALAWVEYEENRGQGKQRSLILFIKPTLTGDEPRDVSQYQQMHPDFPQESTFDQDFDEAQWESYRKLGEHIGEKLFGDPENLAFLRRLAASCPWPARDRSAESFGE